MNPIRLQHFTTLFLPKIKRSQPHHITEHLFINCTFLVNCILSPAHGLELSSDPETKSNNAILFELGCVITVSIDPFVQHTHKINV